MIFIRILFYKCYTCCTNLNDFSIRTVFNNRARLFSKRNYTVFKKTGGKQMNTDTKKAAGWLIIILPTVIYGGFSILNLIITKDVGIVENPLRKDFFKAGHAHAGILLILSLVCYLYVDRAALSEGLKQVVRSCIPLSAIFVPAAFFFSMLSKDASEPNAFINLAYIGILLLVIGLLTLGIGLIRAKK